VIDMNSRLRIPAFVLALVSGVLAVAPLPAQVLVSSFENDLTSTLGPSWNAPATYSFVPTGATEGASALEITHSVAWNIQSSLVVGLPLAQLASQNDYYSIDITTADAEAFDGKSPGWRTAVLIVNSNTGGWQQTDIPLTLAPDDGTSVTTTGTVDLVASGIKAAAADYVTSGGGEGTWFELFLAFMGDDTNNTPVGDYAASSRVDAADYTRWRDSLGGEALPNESVSFGIVDMEDYDEWKANFGADYRVKTIIDNVRFSNTPPEVVGSGSVPEPSTALLAIGAAIVAGLLRRARA
jgi:hypothetical protein